MTFNDNASVGGNSARRRGAGVAVAGGGIAGIGAIAVVLFQLFTGTDISGLLGGGGVPNPADTGSAIANCQTGADANANDECRLAAATLSINQFWAENVEGYREPRFVIVDVSTGTACGTASNATGPFYCPPEEAIYVDPTFFALLRERFDASAGPLAQLYVVAHEYGHHIQQITGIMGANPDNGTGEDSNGVRMELQADCFAGAWVAAASTTVDENGVPYLQAPTPQQIGDALNAAQTVGDDHIQQQSGGTVNPETWTHGSSDQRARWFTAGLEQGISACDTFSVAGSDL